MPQLFHRRSNALSRITVFGSVLFFVGVVCLAGAIDRSDYVTQVNVVRDQPIPFSHKHHVGALGIDCRYCHTSVEQAASAGIPSSKVCMTCHSVLWNRTEMLATLRDTYQADESIEWTRVHDLADFAYFNHSIHLAKGVGCRSCHGEVDEMPLMWRENTLHMEWCLDCHRDPTPHLRPREALFDMQWTPDEPQSELGARLAQEYDVRPRDNCSTCHR